MHDLLTTNDGDGGGNGDYNGSYGFGYGGYGYCDGDGDGYGDNAISGHGAGEVALGISFDTEALAELLHA